MAQKPISTRINAALKRLGREERFYRGRGYYYVSGGHSLAGLYVFQLDNTSEADTKMAVDYVNEVLASEGETRAISI